MQQLEVTHIFTPRVARELYTLHQRIERLQRRKKVLLETMNASEDWDEIAQIEVELSNLHIETSVKVRSSLFGS